MPYVIDAADDSATVSSAGGTAVANVLANDRLGGIHVTPAHVTLTQQSSTSGGVTLDPATGAVEVAPGTPIGIHALVYRICEIASASNCDDGTVTVTVRAPFVIDAVNDSATTLPGRQALASVLANDTLDGTPATSARVTLSVVSSTSPGILLNASTGSVFVLVGTAPGSHTLTYRICEIASPINCDTADVAITVNPFPIDAVNDTGAAPRSGGTALGNVLANDTFAGAVATLARVRLSQLGVVARRHLAQRGQRRRDRRRRDADGDLHAPVWDLRDRDPVQLRRGDRHRDGHPSLDHRRTTTPREGRPRSPTSCSRACSRTTGSATRPRRRRT